MRIISGALKGKLINFLRNSKTRPLKDAVRENIFNILKHSNSIYVKVENSYILDLYSGVGSFGIESISRGANKVTFLEKDKLAAKTLNENLSKLLIKDKAELINCDAENYLSKKLKKKFDIIFLDPPFKDKSFIKNLELIKKNNLFRKDHIIIIHREKKTDDDFKKLIKVINIKIYGRSKIIFGRFI